MAEDTQAKAISFPSAAVHSDIAEDKLTEDFKKTIELFEKRASDLPKYSCCSFETFCFKRNVNAIEKQKTNIIEKQIWKDLQILVLENDRKWICNYCYGKINDDIMSSTCILNKMFTHQVPPEISCLNE